MLKQLKEIFSQEANPVLAQKQAAYLRGLFPFFGITKPRLAEVIKPIFKSHPVKDEKELGELLKTLWSMKEREYHYTALHLAKKYKKLHTQPMITIFEHMIRQKSWWDSVDEIAANLVGPHLTKYPELIALMDKWISDPHLWIRRTAILFQLRYKEKTDAKRLFSLCEKTMHEKEFFMRKAIGWSLREYSKTNPEAVSGFLKKNREKLSSLSTLEGSKYLSAL